MLDWVADKFGISPRSFKVHCDNQLAGFYARGSKVMVVDISRVEKRTIQAVLPELAKDGWCAAVDGKQLKIHRDRAELNKSLTTRWMRIRRALHL